MDRRRSPAAARAWLGAVLLAVAAGANAQDRGPSLPEVRLSTAQGPAFALGKAGARWAQLVNERAPRTFEVKTYPGAVLAGRDAAREFGALRDGTAEMAVGSALAWSAQLPVFAVYVLPWLAPDARAQEALAADAALLAHVAASAARSGVVVVAVAPAGERVLATVKEAVQAPADVAGLAVRVIPNQLVIETLAALGARPESLDFGAAQAAFAAGRLGGQEATPSTLAATRAATSGQKFVTRWGAFADQMVFAVRGATWEAWSDEQRAAVRAAALEAAREAAAPAREDAALVELTAQGITIVKPTPAQRAAFRAAVQPVWAKWTAVVGADAARAAEATVAAAGK